MKHKQNIVAKEKTTTTFRGLEKSLKKLKKSLKKFRKMLDLKFGLCYYM
jgi:hypothetical protein